MRTDFEKILRLLALYAVLTCLFGCGGPVSDGVDASAPSTRGIRNGQSDSSGAVFPDVRRLHRSDNIAANQFHCSSVAISSRLLLTAGHCADKYRNEPDRYQMLSPTGTYVPMASVSVHPDYRFSNPIGTTDFAIVELDGFGFDGFLNDAGQVDGAGRNFRRFHSGSPPAAGQVLQAAGFGEDGGANNFNHNRLFGSMFFTRVLTAETVAGGSVPGGLWELAPRSNQITCAGDSGGPVVVDGKIGGVASFVSFVGSNYTCGAVSLAVYAATSVVGQWIDSVARAKDPMNECRREGIFTSRDGGCKSPIGIVFGRAVDIPGKGWDLSWDEAASYCDASQEAGQGDWRLPSEAELQSFLQWEGADHAAVEKLAEYWSSTASSSTAKAVNFSSGASSEIPKSQRRRVVCVRG